MAYDLDVRQFLRRAPRSWLKRYFDRFEVLEDFDWESLGTRNIEPLFDAWNQLDEPLKLQMGQDFSNLQLIGSAGGKTVIIDEAQYHPEPESVAPALVALPDPLSCAFWAYFERPKLWNGAIFFSAADLKSKKYWRKRLNMPKLGREPKREDADAHGVAVSEVFMTKEARGAHCQGYPYRRRDKEYYFAYPQDHRSNSNEYDEEGNWTQRPYNPAFEIIFVHDDADQTLSIWHQGGKDRIKDLQVAFAKTVLGQDIERNSPKDDRVYDLEGFTNPNPKFKPQAGLGIENVEVRKLSIRTLGSNKHTVRIELGPDTPEHVLYQRLEVATRGLDATELKVAGVGLRVTFDRDAEHELPKSRSFDLSWPNSCSLDDDRFRPTHPADADRPRHRTQGPEARYRGWRSERVISCGSCSTGSRAAIRRRLCSLARKQMIGPRARYRPLKRLGFCSELVAPK